MKYAFLLLCFILKFSSSVGQNIAIHNVLTESTGKSNITSTTQFFTSQNVTQFLGNSPFVSVSSAHIFSSNLSSSGYSQAFGQAHIPFGSQNLYTELWSSGWSASRITGISAAYGRLLSSSFSLGIKYNYSALSADSEEGNSFGNVSLHSSWRLSSYFEIGTVINNLIPHFDNSQSDPAVVLGLGIIGADHISCFLALENCNRRVVGDMRLGLEYKLHDTFGFSFGSSILNQSLSLGAHIYIASLLHCHVVSTFNNQSSTLLSIGLSYSSQ